MLSRNVIRLAICVLLCACMNSQATAAVQPLRIYTFATFSVEVYDNKGELVRLAELQEYKLLDVWDYFAGNMPRAIDIVALVGNTGEADARNVEVIVSMVPKVGNISDSLELADWRESEEVTRRTIDILKPNSFEIIKVSNFSISEIYGRYASDREWPFELKFSVSASCTDCDPSGSRTTTLELRPGD